MPTSNELKEQCKQLAAAAAKEKDTKKRAKLMADRLQAAKELRDVTVVELRAQLKEIEAQQKTNAERVAQLRRDLAQAENDQRALENTGFIENQIAKMQEQDDSLIGRMRGTLEELEAAVESGVAPFDLDAAAEILKAWRYGAPSPVHGGRVLCCVVGELFYRKSDGAIVGSHNSDPRDGTLDGQYVPPMVTADPIWYSLEANARAKAA